ncbi:MAG: ATP synthase F0 subunit B [Winogradskyella sp.]|jgi:F-type H+-transporting ATPase subunit b|uniref:ATP synthase subunit b n=1 Tax=Winogradskyella poriferorum TaxID=307627 RepID=A0ABU7W2V0_9FLAO|nr:F0F1 ATP synthase subunit B [Winogradskyella algicola]MBL85388.1 ATP synthase F0 subunit B [Winogradskyella sp.]|tara:strand:+ start:1650 stop:2150 length:501 start_codon:yes stop_codon:yes gene_type:complete
MEQLLNDFSPGLFIVQTILFLLLIFLMVKFAWKPILNSLNDREEGIKSALDAAENAKKEMENLNADNERLLKEARIEREALLKEAREMKDKIISDATNEAQEKAGKMIEQAQAAIETEKKAAMAELKSHVAGLSIEIAEKVVREELSNKDKQLKLVEDMLGETTLN